MTPTQCCRQKRIRQLDFDDCERDLTAQAKIVGLRPPPRPNVNEMDDSYTSYTEIDGPSQVK